MSGVAGMADIPLSPAAQGFCGPEKSARRVAQNAVAVAGPRGCHCRGVTVMLGNILKNTGDAGGFSEHP
jgi:hypothetical protein